MTGLPVRRREFRWLDFDIENRPMSYWYDGATTAQVTAIAACFVGEPKTMRVWLLGRDEYRTMLDEFSAMYAEADGVTGHFILRHDLPILQGALVEQGLRRLSPKLVHDTKVHLAGWKDLPKTQEHLAEMLGLKAPKVHMTQAKWREANRLTPEGLLLTEKRVVGDVRQHMALRAELLKRGLLRRPTTWGG